MLISEYCQTEFESSAASNFTKHLSIYRFQFERKGSVIDPQKKLVHEVPKRANNKKGDIIYTDKTIDITI